MDSDKGALLSWIAMVFMRRGARAAEDQKPWLPDLPNLSSVLLSSDTFVLTDGCREEMRLLGVAANYTFMEFLENDHTPLRKSLSSVPDPSPVPPQYDSSSASTASASTSSTIPSSQSERFAEAMAYLSPRGPSVAEVLDDISLDSVILADLQGDMSDDGSAASVSMASAVSSLADFFADVAIAPPVDGPEELSDLAGAPDPNRPMSPPGPRD